MNPLLRTRHVTAGAALLGVFALSTVRLVAQDVTVTPPAWFDDENAAGDQPPELKRGWSLPYPSEMRKADELGYALIGQAIDEKGKRAINLRFGSHPYFKRAVEQGLGELDMRAARKDGKPVASISWFAVIFNPAQAKAKGPDASPRLLAVAPVVVPTKMLKGAKPPDFPAVWAMVKLDDTGAPRDAMLERAEDEIFQPAIEESLKRWRFAPARKAGQAISSEVRVPFLVIPAMKPNVAQRMSPPKVLKRVDPVYPLAMRMSGMRAEVTVSFVVTDEGRVTDAIVLRSTNPAFEQPALEAIRKWTFQPAMQNGKAVNTKMEIPISFALQFAPDGGSDAYSLKSRNKDKNLPEGLRYDTPAKIRGVIVPVYPYELRRDNVRGNAAVGFVVDESGKVARVDVLEATHPEFGLALTAAVEQFAFDPALKDGTPMLSVLRFKQDFNAGELPDPEGASMLNLEKKHPEKIFSAGALDAPLKPISQRPPVFPVAHAASGEGSAVVEIIIDDKGHVRLPRVVSASAPDFGYSAVQAVSQWQFEPPKVKGKPAAVRARAPFTFSIKTAGKPQTRAEQTVDSKSAK
jgi:TonB family protein